ncbi:MAG TPA: DUF2244 domain-containing protein [Caulobacteraceae bacterium]|jgi:uncharacterized membrane protein|nr:DUF2244 domain-containing protein [Caulobacteraceae bacterium]
MEGPYYMDAVIRPHRSLSRRGFIILIAALTGINSLTALLFLALHAVVVPLFIGLDVIVLVVALIASRRAARSLERVQVTSAEVRVVRETPRGEHTVWLSPTAFTRVALVDEDGDDPDLQIRLSDRGVAVAKALTRSERRDFAVALERAIRRARAGPASA